MNHSADLFFSGGGLLSALDCQKINSFCFGICTFRQKNVESSDKPRRMWYTDTNPKLNP